MSETMEAPKAAEAVGANPAPGPVEVKEDPVNSPDECAARLARINEEVEEAKVAAQGGRTNEDITLQAPIHVVLGGETIEIPILAYRPNKKWREAFREIQKKNIADRDKKKGKTDEEISSNFTIQDLDATEAMILDDKVGLVVLYLELTHTGDDLILDVATNQELLAAYDKIEAVASPLSDVPARTQS